MSSMKIISTNNHIYSNKNINKLDSNLFNPYPFNGETINEKKKKKLTGNYLDIISIIYFKLKKFFAIHFIAIDLLPMFGLISILNLYDIKHWTLF